MMTRRPASSQWSDELDELERRRRFAMDSGRANGEAPAQMSRGRSARERVLALVDPGSMRELGILAGKGHYAADGALESAMPSIHVLCLASIAGRRAVVIGEDSGQRGGSSEAAVAEKWVYAERYAQEYRLPLVRLVDSAGGSVKLVEQMGYTKIPGYALTPSAALLGEVPVVAVAMGACAGLGAIRVGTSHFAVMVKGASQVFAGGPPVVKRALGVDVTKDELGGWDVHRKSGLVQNAAQTEEEALGLARRFLSYLPANVWEQPPRVACDDDPAREDPWLNDAIPRDRRKLFDARRILAAVFDADSVFEIAPQFGGSVVTALARLAGHPVGVMINNPAVMGGAFTLAAARKTERFVDTCDTFHLPIVNLVDQPGTMTGVDAEAAGTVSAVLRASAAIEQSSVPWLAVVIRRCFGLAGGMISPWMGASGTALPHRFAWPSARWGSLPVEGGVTAAYRRELATAEDPQALLEELERKYHGLASPFRTAERFGVVDIIEPAKTRALLCDWVVDAWQVTAGNLGPKRRVMR